MARANPERAPVAPPFCRTASWCWTRCGRGRRRAGSGSQRRPPPVKWGTQSGCLRTGSCATSSAGPPTIALRLRTSSAASSPPLPRRRSARRQKGRPPLQQGARCDLRPAEQQAQALPAKQQKRRLGLRRKEERPGFVLRVFGNAAFRGLPAPIECPKKSTATDRPGRRRRRWSGPPPRGRGRRDLGDPAARTPRPRPLPPAYTARGTGPPAGNIVPVESCSPGSPPRDLGRFLDVAIELGCLFSTMSSRFLRNPSR